jgi:hypothetical protein
MGLNFALEQRWLDYYHPKFCHFFTEGIPTLSGRNNALIELGSLQNPTDHHKHAFDMHFSMVS